MWPGATGWKIKGKKIRGVPKRTHLGEIHLYKAGRSLYWERPAVFMLQQARPIESPLHQLLPTRTSKKAM